MTRVIHRARVSPVVCAHALVSKYTSVWYGIRWYTSLWYATLWCTIVRSFVLMSLCPNAPFPHHRLSKLQKSLPSENVQTNVQINVQTNIFLVYNDTTKVPNWRLLEDCINIAKGTTDPRIEFILPK